MSKTDRGVSIRIHFFFFVGGEDKAFYLIQFSKSMFCGCLAAQRAWLVYVVRVLSSTQTVTTFWDSSHSQYLVFIYHFSINAHVSVQSWRLHSFDSGRTREAYAPVRANAYRLAAASIPHLYFTLYFMELFKIMNSIIRHISGHWKRYVRQILTFYFWYVWKLLCSFLSCFFSIKLVQIILICRRNILKAVWTPSDKTGWHYYTK